MPGLPVNFSYSLSREDRRKVLLLASALIILITLFQFNKKRTDGYTPYNNYVIFVTSFPHLLHEAPLYSYHNDEYFDLYKYSPTFPVFMLPFYYLPDLAGLILWNLLNGLVLVYGLTCFNWENRKMAFLGAGIVFLELITSLQNSQSNGLVAGLSLLAISGISRGKYYGPSLFILLGAFIKIFTLLLFLGFILKKIRWQLILFNLVLLSFLVLLPLVFVPFSYLFQCYTDWLQLLQADRTASYGISVLGMVNAFFPYGPGRLIVTAGGFLLLSGSYVVYQFLVKEKNASTAMRFTAGLLVWMVLFNHKGESPTYVIAVAGCVLLLFSSGFTPVRTGLLVLLILLTCLSPTDLFPAMVRNRWIVPYSLKTLPCLLVYLYFLVDQVRSIGIPGRSAEEIS